MDSSRPRKKRDTSKKREEILNGAIEAFREYGYETTSMDQIARMSGASKRTLYNHFDSREALLEAIISRYLKGQQELRAAIVYDRNGGLDTQLARFVDAELYLVDSPGRRTLARVLTSIFLWDTALAVKTRSTHDTGEDPLITWLEAAAADGRIRPGESRELAGLFRALTQGLLTWPALFMPELTEEFVSEKRRVAVALFLKEAVSMEGV